MGWDQIYVMSSSPGDHPTSSKTQAVLADVASLAIIAMICTQGVPTAGCVIALVSTEYGFQ
ncbi:hypothetical protein P692DRAFT_20841788 [Suillus brevipes Sb2]|nr:hypothetical protein P692DRAFT_20841788 [Suillus brevipes Sb2]